MTREIRKYTDEFKQEAVNLAIKLPSVVQAAKELGIPAATLHCWVDQLKKKPIDSKAKSTQPDMTALLEENRRLHKENAILKEEREILKKAASYFAQHQK